MKKTLVLLAVLLCLCGCSSKETTTVCKLDSMGMVDEMEIISTNDKVTNLNETVTLKWTDYEIETDDEKDLLEAALLEAFVALSDVDGVEINSEKTEDALVITINMDIVNGDLEAMASAGILTLEDGAIAISLEKSIEGLTGNGYTCK